jgi:hypothetical protein
MKAFLFVGVLGLGAMSVGCSSSPRQTQTEAWLQLQSSNKAASTIAQPSTPIERDLSLQRWLNTYQHAIPEYYEQKKGGSVSGGGGSGG